MKSLDKQSKDPNILRFKYNLGNQENRKKTMYLNPNLLIHFDD